MVKNASGRAGSANQTVYCDLDHLSIVRHYVIEEMTGEGLQGRDSAKKSDLTQIFARPQETNSGEGNGKTRPLKG